METKTLLTPETEQFAQEFPLKIQQWIAKSKNRNPFLLSKLTGVRYPTVSDLVKGKKTILNQHPTRIIKLLTYLDNLEPDKVIQKYQKVLTDIDRSLNERVSTDLASERKYLKSLINDREEIDLELSTDIKFTETFTETLKNPVAISIYTSSLKNSGTTREYIKVNFGTYGETILEDLLQKRILVTTNDHDIFPINKESIQLSRKNIQALIPSLNSLYCPSRAKKERNYNTLRIDSISENALFQIYELFADLDNKLTNILSKKSSRGDIPFYCFSQMDTTQDKI